MKERSISTGYITRIGLLAVIGLISEMFNFALPLMPPFLKFDFSNLPSLLGGIGMGPMAAVFIELVKNLLKVILNSQTVGIGELSNFICGASLSVPAAIVYGRRPGVKSYIKGGVFGVLSLVIVAGASNYFLIIPAYAAAFGGIDRIVALCAKINPSIVDMKALIILGVAPFNLIKGSATVIAGFMLHKYLAAVFRVKTKN